MGWLIPDRPKVPEYSYEEVRPQMQTGDVVVCSGTGTGAFVIKVAERSCYTHVGLVRVDKDGAVLLLHTVPRGRLRDKITGTLGVDGPQVVDLSGWIQQYRERGGHVYWRQLIGERTPEMLDAIEWNRHRFRFSRYERKPAQMLGAVWHRLSNSHEDRDTFVFCSEYVAHLLAGKPENSIHGGWSSTRRVGAVIELVYPDGTPREPSRYSPKDWSAQQCVHGIVEAPGYEFRSEVEVM